MNTVSIMLLVLAAGIGSAYAEAGIGEEDTHVTAAAAAAKIPEWVKNSAGWWAGGQISDSEFMAGISFLVSEGVIVVPEDGRTAISSDTSEGYIPPWIKSNAGWWAGGQISSDEFLSSIQYLVTAGLIEVPKEAGGSEDTTVQTDKNGRLAELEARFAECDGMKKTYDRIDCKEAAEYAILVHSYKSGGQSFAVGPITYYWLGMGSEGNTFEISSSGQALLAIRMLAENTSTDVQTLSCTSPSLCNYDVWDGSTTFRYAATDFTSGQIVLNPDAAREFNILFGPNVGYGGSQFLYDESKTYHFRINESFGSESVELNLD